MADNLVQVVISAESSAAVQGFQAASQAAQSFSGELTSTASASASASVALQTTAASADATAASFTALDIAAAAVIAVVAAVAVAVGGAAFAMGSAVNSAIDLGDATRRLTRETGIASEQGSELLGVFDRYGVSADAASRSLGIFEKNLRTYVDAGTAAHEKTTGFAGAINELGIQTQNADGSIRPMSALLDDVANKFANLQDGPEKTALAMQLFGRSGKDMIDVLDQGGPAIDAMAAKMGELGLSMSTEQVANVRAYELAHKDLDQAIQGVSVQLGNALMPAMTAVMQSAAGLAEAFNTNVMPSIRDFGAFIAANAQPALAALAGGFSEIVPIVTGAAQAIFDAGQTLVSMAEAAYTWGANIVTQFANGMASAMQPIFDVINSIGDAIASLMEPGSPPKFLPNIDIWGHDTAQVYLDAWKTADVQAPIDAMGGNLKDALTKVNNEIQDLQDKQKVEALQKQIATGKLHGDQLAMAQLEIQKTLIAEQQRNAPAAAAKSGGGGGGGGGAKQAEADAKALAKAKMEDALASADAAGKVQIYQDALNAAKPGTVEAINLHKDLTNAQKALEQQQDQTAKAAEAAANKQKAASEAIEKAQLADNLAKADGAGKVALLTEARDKETKGSVEWLNLDKQIVDQQARNEAASDSAAKAAASHAKTLAGQAGSLASAQEQAALAGADHAGKLAILQDAYNNAQTPLEKAKALTALLKEEHVKAGTAAAGHGAHTAALAGHHAAAGGAAASHAGHVGHLAGAHGGAAKKAADHAAAMDRLKDGLDGLQKPTTGITTLTQDAARAHDAYVTAAGHVHDAIQGIKDKFAMVSDFVHGTVIPAFNAIKDAMTPMVVSVTSAVQNINDIFQNYGIKAGLTAMLDYAKVWGGEFLGWIAAQAPVILSTLDTWASSFVAAVGPLTTRFLAEWPGMLNTFLDWIGGAAGPILAKLGDWAVAFVEWIPPNIPNILTALAAVAGAMLTWIGETAATLLNKLGDWTNDFALWLRPVLPQILQALGDILTNMLTWVSNAGVALHPSLVNLGNNIVDGIKAGIADAWGALTSWASGKMNDLVNALKSAIKIGSPSRVMADEIGQWIPKGIALGIDEHAHHVDAAMGRLAGRMLGGGQTAYPDTRGLQGLSMAGGGAINNYTMIVNTNATAATVQQDFHLMRAMAGG